MENPETWGPAERIVAEVLQKDHENNLKPPEEMLIGLSLNRRITDALRSAGFLVSGGELERLRRIETKARGLVRTAHPDDVGEHEVVREWWDGLVSALNVPRGVQDARLESFGPIDRPTTDH